MAAERTDLAGEKTLPVHQPENRGREQEADKHGQSRQKADFPFMVGQASFSPVNAVECHNFGIYMPGRAGECSPYFAEFHTNSALQIST